MKGEKDMSTFKDIIDTLSSIEGEMVDELLTSKKNQSLSKMSKEGIMNFPIIVTDALTIEDASLVSKSLEKEFASFTLIVMTMNPYLRHGSNSAPTAGQYVNRFHQNIDVKGSPTDLLNAINTFSTEAVNKLGIAYESLEDLENHMLYYVYENVSYYNINKENLKYSYTIDQVTESAILNDICGGKIKPVTEAPQNEYTYNIQQLDVGDVRVRADVDSRAIGRELARGQKASSGRDARQLQHLTDNDAKKANELVPTLLHMRIYPVDKEGNEYPPIDFVLGIKATLHPVSSDEMITNICRGVKNENTFFNFIRWTTGETKFFKDFVFAINELKIDALNSSNKASKWWSMLKRRKALAKIKNVLLPNKMLPNTTIIITQDEVDTIRDVYGYDLTNTAVIDKLMSNYFLIAFVIVDPALQRVKFLFDGQTQFETLTYATLARESSTNDKQFKEMLNMLGRRM